MSASKITVVTRIIPLNANPEDTAMLLKPTALGKPIEVRKSLFTDPRTGMKYNLETTYLIPNPDALEKQKKQGLTPLTAENCALNNGEIRNADEKFAISLPNEIPTEKMTTICGVSKLKEMELELLPKPSIKLHLNLKKIREATRQQNLSKKREKLVQPLYEYFINNECLICGVILKKPNKSKIMHHMFLHIKLGTYACKSCNNKCFSTADALYSHSLRHTEGKNYNCDICNKGFSRKHFLKMHNKNYHPHLFVSKLYRVQNANIVKEKIPTCFVCTICKVKLTSWKLLLNHKNTHKGKESYLCLYCNKTFTTSSLLRYHLHVRIMPNYHSCESEYRTLIIESRKSKSHHKTLLSEQCHRVDKNKHSGSAEFKCKICGKQYKSHCNFVKHMYRHP